jgi:hypothetical protein
VTRGIFCWTGVAGFKEDNKMSEKQPKRAAMSQFLGFRALRRMLRKGQVDPAYRAKVRSRLWFSALSSPLRWAERLVYGWRIKRQDIGAPPVFLLGMGRSGTTHLHYLLWQDPQFGVVTNYQANLHPIALIGRGWLDKAMASKVPSKRPMDNVAITLDAPQEEELALATISEHAAFHFMSFPRELPAIYDDYVVDVEREPGRLASWKRAYWEVLKKASLLQGGRRLLLKTPTNTGRVKLLTEMFPGAKYVYIVRNPYKVYQSMRNMYRKILADQTFQDFEWEEIDRWILHAYQRLISTYLAQRELIPAQDLVEIRYEDLDEQPMECLEKIYGQLELGDFEAQRPAFQDYLDSLGRYEKNAFEVPDDIVRQVNAHWGFAFEAWGYDMLPVKD